LLPHQNRTEEPSPSESQAALQAAREFVGLVERSARRLTGWYLHNWQHDPLAGGAYSYVAVGDYRSQRALARPVSNTLFFAGEATESSGHHATVHGALASGERAAREAAWRWQHEGRSVRLARPNAAGEDFNDLIRLAADG